MTLEIINARNLDLNLAPRDLQKVRVGIIDVGFDLYHPNLNHVIFIGEKNQNIKQNHGTMVSGFLSSKSTNDVNYNGLLPGLKIYFFEMPELKNDYLIAAIKQAISMNIDILNISLGTYTNNIDLESIVDDAILNDITIIASAGNEATEALSYPASIDGVISVGAIDRYLNVMKKTNYNEKIDIFAPGWETRTLSNTDKGGITNNFSGTSLSALYVTTLAILIKSSNPELKNHEIEEIILASSRGYIGNWGGRNVPIYLLDYKEALIRTGGN